MDGCLPLRWPDTVVSLQFLDGNTPARCTQVQLRPPTVDLGLERPFADFPANRDGKIRSHASAAGTGVQIHFDVLGQMHRNPSARRRQPAVMLGLSCNAGRDRSAGGRGIDHTHDFIDMDTAPRGVGVNIPAHLSDRNTATRGSHIGGSFTARQTDASTRRFSLHRALDPAELQPAARCPGNHLTLQVVYGYAAPRGF